MTPGVDLNMFARALSIAVSSPPTSSRFGLYPPAVATAGREHTVNSSHDLKGSCCCALWCRQCDAMVPQKHSVAATGPRAKPKATVQAEPRTPAQTVKTRRILSRSTPYRPVQHRQAVTEQARQEGLVVATMVSNEAVGGCNCSVQKRGELPRSSSSAPTTSQSPTNATGVCHAKYAPASVGVQPSTSW